MAEKPFRHPSDRSPANSVTSSRGQFTFHSRRPTLLGSPEFAALRSSDTVPLKEWAVVPMKKVNSLCGPNPPQNLPAGNQEDNA